MSPEFALVGVVPVEVGDGRTLQHGQVDAGPGEQRVHLQQSPFEDQGQAHGRGVGGGDRLELLDARREVGGDGGVEQRLGDPPGHDSAQERVPRGLVEWTRGARRVGLRGGAPSDEVVQPLVGEAVRARVGLHERHRVDSMIPAAANAGRVREGVDGQGRRLGRGCVRTFAARGVVQPRHQRSLVARLVEQQPDGGSGAGQQRRLVAPGREHQGAVRRPPVQHGGAAAPSTRPVLHRGRHHRPAVADRRAKVRSVPATSASYGSVAAARCPAARGRAGRVSNPIGVRPGAGQPDTPVVRSMDGRRRHRCGRLHRLEPDRCPLAAGHDVLALDDLSSGSAANVDPDGHDGGRPTSPTSTP